MKLSNFLFLIFFCTALTSYCSDKEQKEKKDDINKSARTECLKKSSEKYEDDLKKCAKLPFNSIPQCARANLIFYWLDNIKCYIKRDK